MKVSSAGDWCAEHGVPESVCTRCNPELVQKFKDAGDWCDGHGVPESQCTICNPEVKAKWEALRPQSAAVASTESSAGIQVERGRNGLVPPNDPLCQVEDLQIRFIDAAIAAQAGIRTEPAAVRSISAVVECPAETQYDRTRLARITPRAGGVVAEVNASLGTTVAAGDLLAVIDSPVLGEAKSRYIELRENYLLAQADLERHHAIHAAIDRMLEICTPRVSGEEVRRQLAEVRIGEPKSRLLKAHAALELARAAFARKAALSEKGISSLQDYETAQSDLYTAEAEFSALGEAIALEIERAHWETERGANVARVALEAAERRLHILGLNDAAVAALAAGTDVRLARHELRCPLAGTVVEHHAVPGESVTEQQTLFTVADWSRLWLMLDVNERELPALRPGLRVLFIVDGLPGHSFAGTLDWISSQVDERTRTVKARVNLSNDAGLLRANMFGTARIVLRDNEALLTVPNEAVQSDACCRIVFVPQADNLFRPRKVTLGSSANGFVEILSGLSEGERVVTTGSFLLKTEVLKRNIGAGCCEVDPGR